MAKPIKTQANSAPVAAYLAAIDDAQRKADCERLDALMSQATGAAGTMYGASIVGYGTAQIKYADGRTAPWFAVGFSSRKGDISLYGLPKPSELAQTYAELGKHKTATSCVYVKRLADVNEQVLLKLMKQAVKAAA
jgi:hypothetical protein